MIKHVPVLLVAIPLLAAFMIPMIGMVNRTARTVVGAIALVMILAASYYIAGDILVHGRILYYMVGSSNPEMLTEHGLTFPIRIGLKIDPFSLFFIIMTTTLVLIFYVFSAQYIEENERKNYFTVLFITMVAGMMGLLVANDLFTFFV
ncbi:MAG TPA: hypothetical protein PK348_07925, partial [Spirochaetota bacterium]|nr:hypothetical protein [Spirochaetota bacterium]